MPDYVMLTERIAVNREHITAMTEDRDANGPGVVTTVWFLGEPGSLRLRVPLVEVVEKLRERTVPHPALPTPDQWRGVDS